MNTPAPKTIGQQLAAARLAKGWSLEEAAHRTNLKPALVTALEADEFNKLPNLTVTRGFIRLYAQKLGLDEWALLRQVHGAAETPVDMLDLEPEDLEAIPTRTTRQVSASQGVGLALLIAVVLFALGIGAYKLYTIGDLIKNPDSAPAAAAQPAPAPPKPVDNIPVAKPIEIPLPKVEPAPSAPPPAAVPIDNAAAIPKAQPVTQPEPLAAPPAEPLKGLRLQLIADADAPDASRWVRVIAIRDGKEETLFADAIPPGKVFPETEPWVADAYIIVLQEASAVGIIQNGGPPQKYELPGVQRVKLPVN